MRKAIGFSLIMALALATAAIGAGKPTPEQERLAASVIGSYNAADDAAVAAMMLYAPGDSSAERTRMARAMRVLLSIFGPIRSFAPPTENYEYLPVTASPKGQPSVDAAKAVYEVEFERLGRGFVIIEVANVEGRDAVASIAFALPPDRQDARAILNRALRNIE